MAASDFLYSLLHVDLRPQIILGVRHLQTYLRKWYWGEVCGYFRRWLNTAFEMIFGLPSQDYDIQILCDNDMRLHTKDLTEDYTSNSDLIA